MTATAPTVDRAALVEALRVDLEQAERASWAHGQWCRLVGCSTCITHMTRSNEAFDALAAVAGEDDALDVLAGAA